MHPWNRSLSVLALSWPKAPLILIHFGRKWQCLWLIAVVTVGTPILVPYEERAIPHGHWASSHNTIPSPSPHHLSTLWTCQAASVPGTQCSPEVLGDQISLMFFVKKKKKASLQRSHSVWVRSLFSPQVISKYSQHQTSDDNNSLFLYLSFNEQPLFNDAHKINDLSPISGSKALWFLQMLHRWQFQSHKREPCYDGVNTGGETETKQAKSSRQTNKYK